LFCFSIPLASLMSVSHTYPSLGISIPWVVLFVFVAAPVCGKRNVHVDDVWPQKLSSIGRSADSASSHSGIGGQSHGDIPISEHRSSLTLSDALSGGNMVVSLVDLDGKFGKMGVITNNTQKSGVLPFVDPFGEERGVNAFVAGKDPMLSVNRPIAASHREMQHQLSFSSEVPVAKQFVLALGGGTGALRGGKGDAAFDRDIIRRMRYQDKAVLLLLMLVYVSTLCVGVSMTYRQSLNSSTVTFYADPRYHSTVTEDVGVEGFLDAFAQAPKSVHLQVTGFVPMPEPIPNGVDWNGKHYHVAFTFSLDLSPWVVALGNADLQDSAELFEGGVVAEDRQRLTHFLANNSNDLATVEVQKEVMWAGWEELATNIKHQIRQRGFTNGVISVRRCEVEPMEVYQNKDWANFMHSRLTKVLCALSLVGWFVYLPYMYFRCSKLIIRSRYKVDVSISHYWNLIVNQLGADGFDGISMATRSAE